MPRGRGERWVDPAPLEIARPRLPWWLYLPWWVLALLSPVLAVAVVLWLIVVVLRRVYRYPLLCLLVVLAWWSELVGDWVSLLVYAAVLAGLAGLGWWLWCCWLVCVVWAELLSECRRLGVYAIRWHRTMVFSDLAKKVDRKTYIPKLVRCGPMGGGTGLRCGCWRVRRRCISNNAVRPWRIRLGLARVGCE